MAVLTSSGSFTVVPVPIKIATFKMPVYPARPIESGFGRLIHPVVGVFDYEVKPDQWVNIHDDLIVSPIWASTRTMKGAANVLWDGDIRDVVVEERWLALGGMAMPIGMLRMLAMMYQNPIDPSIDYVRWYPNYITPKSFKVLLVNLTAGGNNGLVFDDVINAKTIDGEENGWMTQPVTLTIKIADRL